MDDLKLYSRSEKGWDSLAQTIRVFSEDIGERKDCEVSWYKVEDGKVRGR